MAGKYTLHRAQHTYLIVDPDGGKVEQHADPDVADARLAHYNRLLANDEAPVRKESKAQKASRRIPELAPGSPAALEGTLGELRSALEAGDLDAHLSGLLGYETGEHGKQRKGAISAIEDRIEDLATKPDA